MKASVPLLTGCVALGLTLPATVCLGNVPHACVVQTAVAATGQYGPDADAKRRADDLLRQARGAIKEKNFRQAEALISEAEKLGVKYDPLTARFVDTPEKLRTLLAEERAKTPASGPAGNAVPSDPYQIQMPAGPQAQSQVVDQLTGDGKSRSLLYLKDARTALAAGDKLAALAAWQKAAGIPATFGPNEDSPQRLAADLVKAGVDPSRLVPVNPNPASPYALRPGDIDPASDRLPQLSGAPGIPAAAAPGGYSPYNLPAETNPLAQGTSPANVYGNPGNATSPYGQAAPSPSLGEQTQRLPVGDDTAKAEAQRLVSQARVALDKGDIRAAQQFAEQAEALNVPDTAFAPNETRPWQVLLEVNRARYRSEGVAQASGNGFAGAEPHYPVAQGAYNPATDASRVAPAASQSSVLSGSPQATAASPGQSLFEQGLRALEQQDRQTALRKFQEAWRFESQLDPETRQQLKDKLTFLGAAGQAQPLPEAGLLSPIEQVNSQQSLLRQKLMREQYNEEQAAQKLAQTDPKGALANLQKFRDRVSSSDLEPAGKKQMLTLVDRKISELGSFIEQNKATIENDERNEAIRSELVRNQERTIESQNKLAELVEQYNKLLDEQRFAEAEIIARQANEIAPREPVVVNMLEKVRLVRGLMDSQKLQRDKEDMFVRSLNDVERSSIQNVGDDNPLVFDVKRWGDLTKSRRRLLGEQNRLSPAEMEIQRSLTKPVEVRFVNRPLAEVLDALGRMTGINVYLDPQGMAAEGVSSDTAVTLNLTQPISLKSSLNLLLSPLGLSYVIQNEVLKITSEQTRDANVYVKTYYVADLVMPIPNFVPNYNLGLPGAIRESLNAMGYGQMPRSMAGPYTVAKNGGPQGAMPTSTELLAQANDFGQSAMMPTPSGRPGHQGGPGGLGGGVVADFDSLIDLITTTVSPTSWDDVGGPGSIMEFEGNLSLVVSQTQEVHEQIADLLEQLRRLQDLQVTIEVRFITLSDNFFERIGVDFDFAIDDNTNLNRALDILPIGPGTGTPVWDDDTPSVSIGLGSGGIPTADLDIPFTQDFSVSPQFGPFDPNAAANFGFAILSDIEVYFLLTAAQGDVRTNILQAPKVTLFNGQTAFVSDSSQRPFVTSVIPVVGDFAAAQQPVIVVLNEGTSLSVSAVVSSDRRFVRLTLVPFFSQIGEVEEFTFTGKVTTDSGTTVVDPSNPDQNVTNGQTRTVEGTTVQLPTFAFTTVTTTVSVPDGGTVLLGGIKRLREGRTERGVPLLSKIPWVSRLFKNVAIGRDAQSLMMMVTPRIIIQEEEEEKLGIELDLP